MVDGVVVVVTGVNVPAGVIVPAVAVDEFAGVCCAADVTWRIAARIASAVFAVEDVFDVDDVLDVEDVGAAVVVVVVDGVVVVVVDAVVVPVVDAVVVPVVDVVVAAGVVVGAARIGYMATDRTWPLTTAVFATGVPVTTGVDDVVSKSV